ncbi:MAG: hypothetical protein KC620_27480, partial [Myxococcales bacterium]|nr:hypothetical protein [Myxococcales bacterium]
MEHRHLSPEALVGLVDDGAP